MQQVLEASETSSHRSSPSRSPRSSIIAASRSAMGKGGMAVLDGSARHASRISLLDQTAIDEAMGEFAGLVADTYACLRSKCL